MYIKTTFKTSKRYIVLTLYWSQIHICIIKGLELHNSKAIETKSKI